MRALTGGVRTTLGRLRDTWRRDIVLRLAVSILLAVLLSTGAYTTYAVRTLHASAELQLRERSDRFVTVLSQALARPLFDINGAALTSVVDAMRVTPEVLTLRVLAPDGIELASFVSAGAIPGQAIRLRRDITFQDGSRSYVVGAIDLTYSRREADLALRRQLFNALSVNLLLALTIVGSIFLVARKAVRPFADIQRALEQLSQGKTNIALSGIGRADQVGRLSAAVRSFRDTLTRLRDAESELRELNGDLEHKIDARTAALKQAMQVARDSEQQLVSANVRAEAASSAKSAFLANLGDQIRTPVSAMIDMATLALGTDLDPVQRDYVNGIHGAALALLAIIDDILDFSGSEAGQLAHHAPGAPAPDDDH